MRVRNSLRVLAAVAAVGLAAACEQSNPVSPPEDASSDFAAAVTIPTTGLNEAVWVCKDAPSGSFDFTVTATMTQPAPGNTVNLIQAAPTIAAGSCTKVADAGNGNNITVTELAEPGYNFDRIEAFYIDLASTTLVADPSGPVYTPTITRNFGDLGRVFVFYNVLPPSTGCTLTLGYWKTHNDSFWGGASPDPTWDLLSGGLAENTIFYLSGDTWFEVFWTAPAGNAYYNLAHQYMAAKLNVLAGADPTAVASALSDAEALFSTYTPAQIGALAKNSSLRAQFISLAGTLGSYNEGLTGPGHCSGGPVD